MANNHKIIHKYKYLNLKCLTIQEDIQFNKKCLSENITPNYVTIHTNSKTKAAQKTIQTARKIWIKEEINSLYTKYQETKNLKNNVYNQITKQFHQDTVEEMHHYVNKWISPILTKKKEGHIKKIQTLIQIQHKQTFVEHIKNTQQFHPRINNLTNIQFTKNENDLLEKSLKHNINQDFKKNIIKDELLNLHISIKKTDKQDQEPLRHNLIHEINKTNLQLNKTSTHTSTNQEMKIIKSISEKLIENNTILTKADKGNTIVIIKKEYYDQKVEQFITSNDFKKLNKDPTQEYYKKTNNILTHSKSLTKIDQNKLKMINPKAPQLKGYPKTHKPNIPIRPIVNFRTAPTYKLCKYLNKIIMNNIEWNTKYNIKNTIDLVNNIKDIHIPKNSIFISFDIKDMYSNIPPQETIQILENDLNNNSTLNNQEIKDIITLTRLCTSQNYFEFNSTYYKQENGLAMGSPLSGLLANIFIHNMEENKIIHPSNPFHNKIIYWYRYVDDVICLFDGNIQESENLLSYLNTLFPTIQFTKETQKYKINYLDLTIENEQDKHSFKIYRKPTQTDLTIPSESNQPWQYKLSAFRSMINRLLNIPMKKEHYEEELKIIKYLAIKNGYKHNIINNMVKNIKKKKINNHNNHEQMKKTYIKVPYNTTLNKAIRKTFNKTNYTLSYSTRNNAFNIINKLTQKKTTNENIYSKSGIYKLECSDCDKFYIGQTGRNFKTRFNEHIQALRSNNTTSMKSNFAEHLLSTDHNYTNMKTNMKIINIINKGDKMNALEEMNIYLKQKEKPCNLLNTQINFNNPIFEKIRNLKM